MHPCQNSALYERAFRTLYERAFRILCGGTWLFKENPWLVCVSCPSFTQLSRHVISLFCIAHSRQDKDMLCDLSLACFISCFLI